MKVRRADLFLTCVSTMMSTIFYISVLIVHYSSTIRENSCHIFSSNTYKSKKHASCKTMIGLCGKGAWGGGTRRRAWVGSGCHPQRGQGTEKGQGKAKGARERRGRQHSGLGGGAGRWPPAEKGGGHGGPGLRHQFKGG